VYYNVVILASNGARQLLLIRGSDDIPMISVYDDHAGQTLVRSCVSNLDNLKYALRVLEDGEI
jgi:hypothetical protein